MRRNSNVAMATEHNVFITPLSPSRRNPKRTRLRGRITIEDKDARDTRSNGRDPETGRVMSKKNRLMMMTFEPCPPLENPRHERFAQALFEGEPANAAYAKAGCRPHDGNCIRLSGNEGANARLVEL